MAKSDLSGRKEEKQWRELTNQREPVGNWPADNLIGRRDNVCWHILVCPQAFVDENSFNRSK